MLTTRKIDMKTRLVRDVLFASALTMGVIPTILAQPAPAQKGLASLFSSAKEEELLEPDLAFKLAVTVKGPSLLLAEVIPAKGYYVYKDKIRFALKDASGVSIQSVRMPTGEVKVDQIFGKTEVFRRTVPVELALQRSAGKKNVTLVASYQGCHEKAGVCYPPIDKAVTVALP